MAKKVVSPAKGGSHSSGGGGGQAMSPTPTLSTSHGADAATSGADSSRTRPEDAHRRPFAAGVSRPMSAMQTSPLGQSRSRLGSPPNASAASRAAAQVRKGNKNGSLVRSTTVSTITPIMAPLHSPTDPRQRPPSPPRSPPLPQMPQIASSGMAVSSPFYSSYLLRPPSQSRSGVAWDAPWGWDTSGAHSPPRAHAVLHPEPVMYGPLPRVR